MFDVAFCAFLFNCVKIYFFFQQSDIKRLRSMSDGATGGPPGEDIFPSLPDSVLEKMGLLGDRTRYLNTTSMYS